MIQVIWCSECGRWVSPGDMGECRECARDLIRFVTDSWWDEYQKRHGSRSQDKPKS